ncbi:hypothetical protein [Paenacidovorax monticola]|uniref:hypothetical protein n=1 Tax=Paenacidovorax monticola TaxID=1926868 RepID=UPI001FE35AE7|nr:hypothetical protein [Paenacidovorax monticola]
MPWLPRHMLPGVQGREAGQVVIGQDQVVPGGVELLQRGKGVDMLQIAGQSGALQRDAGQLVVGQRIFDMQDP